MGERDLWNFNLASCHHQVWTAVLQVNSSPFSKRMWVSNQTYKVVCKWPEKSNYAVKIKLWMLRANNWAAVIVLPVFWLKYIPICLELMDPETSKAVRLKYPVTLLDLKIFIWLLIFTYRGTRFPIMAFAKIKDNITTYLFVKWACSHEQILLVHVYLFN